VPGLNASQFKEYRRSSPSRCRQTGLGVMSAGVTGPFAWMAEMIGLKKDKNFFETRITAYRAGGASSRY